MDRYFILIGGGEIRSKETLEIDRAVASLARKQAGLVPEGETDRRANALFVGTASHDLMPYYNSFHKTYTGELGLKTDVALTVYTEMDEEKLDAKFQKADLIYVGGGNTVFLLESWQKTGLGKRILEAYRRGVPVVGLSAGAICWFGQMYTDSGEQGDAYEVMPAMGLLPGGACPHDNRRRADFAEAIPEGGEWLCIEDRAAVVCRNEAIESVIRDGGDAFLVRKTPDGIEEKKL